MKHFWTKGDGDTVTPLWHQCPSTFSLWSLREVKNLETGASELYHPQVLLRNGEATWLEPLSRHWFHPAPKYPGKVQWLPPTAGPPNFEGSEALRKWKTCEWKTYEKNKRWNIWHVGARTQFGESWQLDMIVTNLVFLQKADFSRRTVTDFQDKSCWQCKHIIHIHGLQVCFEWVRGTDPKMTCA